MFLAKEHAIVLFYRLLIGVPETPALSNYIVKTYESRERLNSRRIGAPEFGFPWSIDAWNCQLPR